MQWQAQLSLEMESLVISNPLSSLEGNASDQAELVGRDSIYSLNSDMLFMACHITNVNCKKIKKKSQYTPQKYIGNIMNTAIKEETRIHP